MPNYRKRKENQHGYTVASVSGRKDTAQSYPLLHYKRRRDRD
ncbi:hypothetical protein T4E_6630 [Trichinella pseudospiralis]|uniref:Uncharacterized protein n=1 Tax=Trichinella pseudospiralis TaxID=6337 RepID=A0A0V0Y363_TRIPS|nr:hypothetical protein T4E_6630 [Trichinella pseudospiralis]